MDTQEAEKLTQLIEFTQLDDVELCTQLLQSHAWNVEAAVNTYLGMGDGGPQQEPAAQQAGPSRALEPPQATVPPRPDTLHRGAPPREGIAFAGVELPRYLAIPVFILRFMTSAFGLGLGVSVRSIFKALPCFRL
jgi:hypothetical protein